jgi:hypothetical protein
MWNRRCLLSDRGIRVTLSVSTDERFLLLPLKAPPWILLPNLIRCPRLTSTQEHVLFSDPEP